MTIPIPNDHSSIRVPWLPTDGPASDKHIFFLSFGSFLRYALPQRCILPVELFSNVLSTQCRGRDRAVVKLDTRSANHGGQVVPMALLGRKIVQCLNFGVVNLRDTA